MEALYAARSGEETRPFTLDTFTMTPEPRFRQAGKTAWMTRNAPSVLVSYDRALTLTVRASQEQARLRARRANDDPALGPPVCSC